MTTTEPRRAFTPGHASAPASPARDEPRVPVTGTPQLLDERISGVAILLLAIDAIGVVVAAAAAGLTLGWAVIACGAVLGTRAAARLYRRRLWLSFYQDLPRSLVSGAAAFTLVAALALGLDGSETMLIAIGETVILFLAITLLPRIAAFGLVRWARRRFPHRRERAVVLGAGALGVDLLKSMRDQPWFGLEPVGFLDPSPGVRAEELPAPLLPGTLHDAIRSHQIDVVVLAFTPATDAMLVDTAITAHSQGATILMVPRMWELYPDSADVERLRGYPLVRLPSAPNRRPGWWVKRGLDSLLAALALVLLAPVIGAAALAVLLESGRPVVFRQDRVGLDGRIFPVFKLRSMRATDETESQTRWSIAGDPRVGPVGRVLRRTSLDELPQLWNILRGDMSFVGPRPERPGFVAEFSRVHERYWARHRVPVGLTGLAQVNGLRGDTSIADRSRYDNYYIANWSLWLDLKIALLTVREVFRSGQH